MFSIFGEIFLMAIKRNYYLPESLVSYFTKWSKPGRDYSPAVAGAMLIWMSLDAALREDAKKLAQQKDIRAAITSISQKLRQSFVEIGAHQTWDALNLDEQTAIVEIIREGSKRFSQKK